MKLFIILFYLIYSISALASSEIKVAGLLGLRSSQTDTDIRGATTSTRTSFQFGALALFPIVSNIEIRSGFIYSQRYTEIKNVPQQGVVTVDYSYFDVPLTLGYRFGDAALAFAGPVVAFNQSREVDCSLQVGCSAINVESVLLPLQIGINFKFLPQAGAEVYYEYISGSLSSNVENMRTVGANFIFYFE